MAMRLVSLYLTDDLHRELKALSVQVGRPVAELMRQAMSEFVERARQGAHSVFDLQPFDSGALLVPWSSEDIEDELLGRR